MAVRRAKSTFVYTSASNTDSFFEATGGIISEAEGYKIHAFTTVGISTFEVVLGSKNVECFIWGAGGGGGSAGGWSFGANSGAGGAAQGTINVSKGLYSIMVGEQGLFANNTDRGCCSINQGGGGPSRPVSSDNRYGGSGGGLSGFFNFSYSVINSVIIAGGGGGGGSSRAGTGNVGGAGGGTTGEDGVAAYDGQTERRGRGGGQSGTNLPTDGNSSSFLPGQLLGGSTSSYGGGGGGGWWGGSAGTYQESNTMGGGGGGSGYLKHNVMNGALFAGSRTTPGNSGNQYRTAFGYSAGNAAGPGQDGVRGLVVIRYQ